MPGNVLQSIGLTPEWFQSVMGGVANGAEAPEAAAPQTAPEMPNAIQGVAPPVNVANQISGGSESASPAPQMAPPRTRRSLLDTVGRISDVLAKVGGAEALYQPTLDAREDRTLALGDHARAVDLDALKTTLTKQQISAGAQGLEAGQAELDDHSRAILGAGVRGLAAIQAAGGDVNKAWPILAGRLGIKPEVAASIGEALTQDPNALTGLNSSLNPQTQQGTQPKEVQLYNLLSKQDPALAKAYLAHLSDPNAQMTPYQQAQIEIARGNLGVAQQNAASNRTRAETTATTAAGKAGAGANAQMAENANTLLGELSGIYDKLNESGAMVNPKNSVAGNVMSRLRSSGVGQLVEGAVGTEAQALRDRVNSIRPALMQSLAKATGMSGKQLDSNADVKLFMQTITDPSASYPANKAAIAGLQKFLAANAKPETPTRALPPRLSAKPAARPAPKAAASGGWGKAVVVK